MVFAFFYFYFHLQQCYRSPFLTLSFGTHVARSCSRFHIIPAKKKTTVFDRSSVLFTKRTHIHFHTHAYCDARRVKRLYRDKNISWKNLLLLFSFFLSKWIRIACFCRSETGRVDFVQMWWILNGNYGPVLGHLCNVSLFFVNKICSKFLGINVITSTSGFWFYYLMRHSI